MFEELQEDARLNFDEFLVVNWLFVSKCCEIYNRNFPVEKYGRVGVETVIENIDFLFFDRELNRIRIDYEKAESIFLLSWDNISKEDAASKTNRGFWFEWSDLSYVQKRIAVIGFKGGLVRGSHSKYKALIYYKANCKVYKVILRDKEFLIK